VEEKNKREGENLVDKLVKQLSLRRFYEKVDFKFFYHYKKHNEKGPGPTKNAFLRMSTSLFDDYGTSQQFKCIAESFNYTILAKI